MKTLVDVWEGALDVDELVFKKEGVAGIIVRLNDMNGGHHMDTNFTSQWEQSEDFLRAPYFVYNPWVDGETNFLWMMDNLPSTGITRLFIDVEVRKYDYDPKIYAKELQLFTAASKKVYPKTTIYTGAWFLSIVAYWPTDVEYWWARYPYALYPIEGREYWTWDKWRLSSEAYGYNPDPYKQCPGSIGLWQCSGDRLILPGTADRPMDMNLFNGNLQDLENWWGATTPTLGFYDKLDILWREAEARDWNLTP